MSPYSNATAYADNERREILEWFESDFKETARSTTSTSRTEDGKVNYRFSVVNNSGYDFSRFSFRVKILNREDGKEIGTATINAGEWASGDRKSFKSVIAIPENVRSISFLMFKESVDYEARPSGSLSSALKDIGDMVTGADGSGGVLGELFGTGGMPGTTTTTRTTTTRTPSGTTTRTTTTRTTTRPAQGSRPQSSPQSAHRTGTSGQRQTASRPQTGPIKSYTVRKTEKKLNKIRLGKSGWTIAALVTGIIFVMAAFGSTDNMADFIPYISVGGVSLATALSLKLALGSRAKRVRMYESKINRNGNTSIDDLASFVGRSPDKVADDLQKMIVEGFFPEAYVDINNRLLVMTRNGEPIESIEKTVTANKKAKRRAAREKGVVPESIDDLLTMTDDKDIKAKLRALRTITTKIDQRVEERPELESQVKEFREKYYPEVVRLTDEYNEKIARLDTEGSERTEGDLEINANPNYLQEQAREIKEQLIKLIDSVTEASENLLEKLHEDEIMDITTDIQMLQTTLASKGLLDSDFDLR